MLALNYEIMIKFLRQIRQRLLTENKFSKYILYAIGEIILVVIGILIALQINNWNEKRKEKIRIEAFLSDIKNDLEQDVEYFIDNKQNYGQIIKNKEWGMSKNEYNYSQKDSLFQFMFITFTDRKLMDVSFNKFLNSGIVKYYQYKDVLDAIHQYYLVDGKQYNIWIDWEKHWSSKELEWWHNNDDEFEWDFTNEFPNVNEENYNIQELINVLESAKGRNQMYYSLIRKRTLLSQFELMQSKAEDLKSIIEENLDLTKG